MELHIWEKLILRFTTVMNTFSLLFKTCSLVAWQFVSTQIISFWIDFIWKIRAYFSQFGHEYSIQLCCDRRELYEWEEAYWPCKWDGIFTHLWGQRWWLDACWRCSMEVSHWIYISLLFEFFFFLGYDFFFGFCRVYELIYFFFFFPLWTECLLTHASAWE